jgi:hypothetical protein
MIKIPSDMEVPAMRRDTSKIENVRWLSRNILSRNSLHPEIYRVLQDIKEELRLEASLKEMFSLH